MTALIFCVLIRGDGHLPGCGLTLDVAQFLSIFEFVSGVGCALLGG
ncbi:hypothetical protein NKH28_33845 [Mesorhizobium sp. M1227]